MQTLSPRLDGVTPRGLAFLAVLALLVPLASGAMAQTPTALLPIDGDKDSLARAINSRGEVTGASGDFAGFNSGEEITVVVWDRRGTPRALPPLAGRPP